MKRLLYSFTLAELTINMSSSSAFFTGSLHHKIEVWSIREPEEDLIKGTAELHYGNCRIIFEVVLTLGP